ncbi:MAG: hypothetical protein WCJ30_19565 [Deltaproteobacteria bacterium]
MSTGGPLAGSFVAVTGEFSCGLARGRIERVLSALGSFPCGLEDPRLSHVARGEVTARLVAQLGAPPHERALATRPGLAWLTESHLDALCREHLGAPLVDAPGTSNELTPVTPDGRAVSTLRDALLDPACTEPAERHCLCLALVASRDARALEALAAVIARSRGVHGAHEAHAFGQLAALGVTRFAHRPPLAIECPLRRTHAADPLEGLARKTGACERLNDDRGRAWLRVRFARIPRMPPGPVGASAPFYALLRAAGRRRDARVWIAGCALPADLAWSSWLALLSPLADRG